MACSRSRRASARRLRAPASYREEDDIYIVHHAFADGADLTYHGTFDGERWMRGWCRRRDCRSLIAFAKSSPEGIRYVEERSLDGGPWEMTEDCRFRRLK